MDGVCGTHGRDEKCIQNIRRKKLKGRGHLENSGVDRRIVMVVSKRNRFCWSGLDPLPQDRDQLQILVCTLIRLRVP
jgi:hypothetical protein